MKKNKFNKEEQNLFAVGGFMTPYGMAGFTPYGVPMGTPSASQITMYYDGLNAKKEIASRRNNKQSNINAGVSSKLFEDGGTLFDYDIAPASKYAIGGTIQTNGSDFGSGMMHIDAGGSHSENPYDGVQIGTDSEGIPNLVEEGEVIFNDYVFSKRIQLDEEAKKKFHFPKKSELSYADAAKKLEKEVKERPNDPISRASFKAQMEQLEEQQERQKQKMEAERAKEAFEALSPEEQTALMQQKAQQDAMEEQAAQEQAMAEAHAAQGQPSSEEMAAMEQQAAMQQQQVSPEEAAMMQQQMAAGQGVPVEGVASEGYAYGGELGEDENLFARGGKTYKGKKLPVEGAFQSKSAFAKEMEKAGFTDEEIDAYMFDEGHGKSILGGYGNYRARTEPYLKKYQPEYYRQVVAEREKQTKASQAEKANKNAPRYTPAVDWGEGKAPEYVSSFSSTTPMSSKPSTVSTGKTAVTEKPIVEKGNNQQGTQTQSLTQSPAASSTSASSSQSSKAAQSAERSKSKSGNIKNVGAWKDDGSFADHWQTYSAPGLDEFLKRKEAEYKAAETDEERAKITNDTAREVNEIQQSYWDYILPNRGKSSYNRDDNVYNHQSMWDERGGNVGFWPASEDGSLSNKIASAINLPSGYNSGDNPAGQGRDGYNGRQTELRFLGSTATGDEKFFNDYVDRFKNLGVSFSPYSGWDNNGERLYRASVINEPAATPEEVVVTPSGAATRAAATVQENPAAAPKASDAEVKKNGEVTTGEQVAPNVVPNLKKESYWGLFGPAVGLGMQMAGIGKPDTSGIDAAIASANSSPYLAEYKPLGNYLTYRPMDVWFEQNALNAQSRATDRSIMNAGANQGGTMAGLIANGYRSQLASGELFRKGLEYNNQDEIAKATFNRGTDQYNADAFTRNSQFNASALNQAKNYGAQLAMQGAAQKLDADAGWYNGIYGNVSGIFDRLNQWEKWKRDHNTIAKMAADGLFGNMSDRQYTGQGFLKTVSAEGGKTKRKRARKKRGFTF